MASTNDFDRIMGALDELDAAVSRCSKLSFDGLTASELLGYLDRLEVFNGKLASFQYELTSPFAGSQAGRQKRRVPGKPN
jgi:hypothetical protein